MEQEMDVMGLSKMPSSQRSFGLERYGQAVVDGHVVKKTRVGRHRRSAELYVFGAEQNLVESDPHLGPGEHRPQAVMGTPAAKTNVRVRGTADVELEWVFK